MKQAAFFLHPWRFFAIIIAFSLFGLVLIYDVSVAESLRTFGNSWHFAGLQAIRILLGSCAFLACALFPPQWWKKISLPFFLFTIFLLVIVLIPGIGSRVQGAQRWITIGPVPIQPSEFAKIGIILFFSSWLEKHQRFAPFLFLTGLVFGLILLQPNLSTACITVILSTVLFFLSGGNVKPLLAFGVLGSVLLGALILVEPYRRERLRTFFDPSIDPLGRSYHIRQITIALGRGGWFGQGIGLSKQKQQYIPEASTDSIFAIYAEETGFVGSLLLIGVYAFLIYGGLQIASSQTEHYRFLVAAGITTWVALHALLNLAAMVALIPLTGVPLPLISYGGSSYLSFMIGLGILASLTKESDLSASKATKFTRVPRRKK